MGLVYWTEYTATASGFSVREVRCECCGEHFLYDLHRRGTGWRVSPYNINNRGARGGRPRTPRRRWSGRCGGGSTPSRARRAAPTSRKWSPCSGRKHAPC